MKTATASELNSVAGKNIFFGHQSVGFNIVEGLDDVRRQHPGVALRIRESAAPDGPGFTHVAIGANRDPESKIREFAARMRGGLGGAVDVAFFKFCYIDFDRDTNAKRLFELYTTTLDQLEREYPKTRFVHVTVPLKATQKGVKATLKTLIGRPDPRIADNLRREEYNQLIRQRYGSRGTLFDLASLEATSSSGELVADEHNGTKVPSLAHEYTHDSGHLNERGRRLIAENLVVFLARI